MHKPLLISFYNDLIKHAAIVYLFFQTAIISLIPSVTILDEFIQLSFLLGVIFFARKNESAMFVLKFYITITIVMALMSIHAIPHRGVLNVAFQIFVHTKYILYVAGIFIFFDVKRIRFLISILMAISTFFLFFDLAFPGVLHKFFGADIVLRGDVIRLVGIQAHTGTLGFVFSLFSVYVLFKFKRENYLWYILFLLCVALVLLTSVRTAMLAFPIVLLWLFKDSLKQASFLIVLLIPALIMFSKTKYADELVYITQQNIEMSIEDPQKSAYIRGMMLYFSFELANENFPIGTGAATFGSVRSDDSNVYAYLGVHNSRFFIEKDGIYDSNFASILGEFGYIGLLFYVAFFLFLTNPKLLPKGYELGDGCYPLIILFVLYSFTNPVFMNTFQIFSFALFYFASIRKKSEQKNEITSTSQSSNERYLISG